MSLDLPGAITLTLAMVAIVWAVNGVPEYGWGDVHTLGFLAAGAVLLIAFVLIERRQARPMLPLGLFRNRSFTAGSVLMAVTMFAFFAILFYLTFYLQSVQNKSAIDAAVSILPMTIVFVVAAPLAGWVSSRFGVRVALVAGAVLTTIALVLFAGIERESGLAVLAPALVLAGLGAGLMMVPAIEAIVGSAPQDKAGVASGVQQSIQQLGSTLGIAVFGAILGQFVTANFGSKLTAALGDSTAVVEQLAGDPTVTQAIALGFPTAAQQALADLLPTSVVDQVTRAAHETFIGGLHTVFLVAAGVTVVAALLSLLVRPGSAAENVSERDGAQVEGTSGEEG